MQDSAQNRRGASNALWLLALVCVAVTVFALCAGAAYSGIRAARFDAARAHIGQIEAVLLLAEKAAEENGLGQPPEVYENLLKSYDDKTEITISAYERYVLDSMIESFGSARGFDFAVTRFADGAGVHTQVYYFPTRGGTDLRSDHYYLLSDGAVLEKNA